MMEAPNKCRLIILSNRLPFNVREESGELLFAESAGGLVTGLSSFLKAIGTAPSSISEHLLLGWPGGTEAESKEEEINSIAWAKYRSYPVFLSEEEIDQFYLGCYNKTVWPLFHYFPTYTTDREDRGQL